MAKFYGSIGFAVTHEEMPGIHKEVLVNLPYTGDVLRQSNKWSSGESVSGTLRLSSRISVIADPYAVSNISAIRYVSWKSVRWVVVNVVIQHPRMILTLGEVYSG